MRKSCLKKKFKHLQHNFGEIYLWFVEVSKYFTGRKIHLQPKPDFCSCLPKFSQSNICSVFTYCQTFGFIFWLRITLLRIPLSSHLSCLLWLHAFISFFPPVSAPLGSLMCAPVPFLPLITLVIYILLSVNLFVKSCCVFKCLTELCFLSDYSRLLFFDDGFHLFWYCLHKYWPLPWPTMMSFRLSFGLFTLKPKPSAHTLHTAPHSHIFHLNLMQFVRYTREITMTTCTHHIQYTYHEGWQSTTWVLS